MSISNPISIYLMANDLCKIITPGPSAFWEELETLILPRLINRIKYSGRRLLKIIFYCVSHSVPV